MNDETAAEPVTADKLREMRKARNIHQRIAEAMRNVSTVQKTKPEGLKYPVILHDTVTRAVRPALLDAGIVYYPANMQHVQNGNRTEVRLDVRFVNIDAPSDFVDVPALGYGVDSSDKGPGKAISYCVKVGLLKALGLETGDETDMHSDPFVPENSAAPTEKERQELARMEQSAAMASKCAMSVDCIKSGIAAHTEGGDTSAMERVIEAWDELTNEEKAGLWVAPTKMQRYGLDPIFTTKELAFLKGDEFHNARKARNGE